MNTKSTMDIIRFHAPEAAALALSGTTLAAHVELTRPADNHFSCFVESFVNSDKPMEVDIQDSEDDGVLDAYATILGGLLTIVPGGRSPEFAAPLVKKHVRVLARGIGGGADGSMELRHDTDAIPVEV